MNPIRTCIGCRATEDQEALVRLAVEASGRVQVDGRRRMPGRGAWLHPSTLCVETAIRQQAFGKAFRRKTIVDGKGLTTVISALAVQRQERGTEA